MLADVPLISKCILLLPNINICLPYLTALVIKSQVVPVMVEMTVGGTLVSGQKALFSLLGLQNLEVKFSAVGEVVTASPAQILSSVEDTQTLDPSIGNLVNLKRLLIGIGSFATIPTEINKLTNLQELNIYRNLTTDGDINTLQLQSFPKLTSLGLRGFKLDPLPATITSLNGLTSLELYQCQISGIFPLFSPNLTYLSLKRNYITALAPGATTYWTKLTTLDVGHNSFTNNIQDFMQFPSLVSLDVEQNRIAGTLPSTAANRLNIIIADQNSISGTIPPEYMGPASKINILRASHNFISGTLPPSGNTVINLSVLDLGYNQITGSLQSYTAPIMTELSLANNYLTGTLPDAVDMPFINKLQLQNNKLAGMIPPIWFSSGEITRLEILATKFVSMDTFDVSGQRIGGGCCLLDLDWQFDHCDFGTAVFYCDCAPRSLCGTAPCYTTDDPCGDPKLNFCGEGSVCVNNATTRWYTCNCDLNNYSQTDYYTCSATQPCNLYGCGDNAVCTQTAGTPVRTCTCKDGYYSPMSGLPISGNLTFASCQVDNLCLLPACNGKPNSNCTLLPSNNRTRVCTCDTGYSVITNSSATSLTMTDATDVFPGCMIKDMCASYGCNGDLNSVCQFTVPGYRTCTCNKGYEPKGNVSLLAGSQVFPGCNQILACARAGCANPTGGTIATCIDDPEANRRCICPDGWTGTLQLALDQAFPGCTEFPECVYRCDMHSDCQESVPNQRICTCDPGWTGSAILIANAPFLGCKDIDECNSTSACAAGNECNNTPGSYVCSCLPGYVQLEGSAECSKVDSKSIVGPIVGAAIGCVVALLLIFFGYYYFFYRYRNGLHKLPPDIRAHYERYYEHPSSYQKVGSGSSHYYSKLLKPDSDAFKSVQTMWTDFFKSTISFDEAYAVYSPTLVNNFINQRELIKTRIINSPAIFNTKKWKNQGNSEARLAVYAAYENRIQEAYDWNPSEIVPIVPAVHATSFEVAQSICATGFVALSSLDAGYYGKGIYFASYLPYTLPYLRRNPEPAVLISFIVMGNTYPVIQHHTAKGSLMGNPLQSGYNSHYVLVNGEGEVPTSLSAHPEDQIFDELVVGQESQIAPAYLIRLGRKETDRAFKKWTRSISEGTRRREESFRRFGENPGGGVGNVIPEGGAGGAGEAESGVGVSGSGLLAYAGGGESGMADSLDVPLIDLA